MKKSIILMVTLSFIGAIVFGGCIQNSNNNVVMDKFADNVSEIKIPEFETTQQLKKFSSIQEIREFLKASAAQSDLVGFGWSAFERGLGDMGVPPRQGLCQR
jgi:hypothetical protein